MLEKHVLGSSNSDIFRLYTEYIFAGPLDTYTKKINLPLAVLWGGGHGKVCWLIVYLFDPIFHTIALTLLTESLATCGADLWNSDATNCSCPLPCR